MKRQGRTSAERQGPHERAARRLRREGGAARRGDPGWGRRPVSPPPLAAAFSLLDGVSPSCGSRDLAASRWPRRARPPAVLGVAASIASIQGLGAAAKEQGSDALREAAWPTARWHRAHPRVPPRRGRRKHLPACAPLSRTPVLPRRVERRARFPPAHLVQPWPPPPRGPQSWP